MSVCPNLCIHFDVRWVLVVICFFQGMQQIMQCHQHVYRTKISCRCKLVVGMMQHGVYQPSNAHAPVLLEFLQHPRSTKASHCRNSLQGFSSMSLGMGCPAL